MIERNEFYQDLENLGQTYYQDENDTVFNFIICMWLILLNLFVLVIVFGTDQYRFVCAIIIIISVVISRIIFCFINSRIRYSSSAYV